MIKPHFASKPFTIPEVDLVVSQIRSIEAGQRPFPAITQDYERMFAKLTRQAIVTGVCDDGLRRLQLSKEQIWPKALMDDTVTRMVKFIANEETL